MYYIMMYDAKRFLKPGGKLYIVTISGLKDFIKRNLIDLFGNYQKLHQEKNAEFAKRILRNNGTVILTTSMMANLTRFWISYIAGVEKINFLKFNIYASVASITWVSLMTILGFLAGYEKEYLKRIVSGVGILAWIFLAIAIFVIIRAIKHEYHHFKKDEPHDEKN